jgi:tetratricopeptide (TPR) repeat protein
MFWVVALAAPLMAAPATEAVISEIAAALEKGDSATARHLADDALADKDAMPLERGRLLLDRGLAHELEGEHQDALADFTGALETHALRPEERAQALLQRGFLLDGMDRLDDAAKDYGAVIALKSSVTATALNNRANVYRRQNRLLEAGRDYQAALAAGTAKPQFPYYGLGQIAEAQHDIQAARGFYAKAVLADPGYQLAADRLAALGGPGEGALTEPDRIVLHPPVTKPTETGNAVALPPPAAKEKSVVPRPRQKPPAAALLRPALDGPANGTEPEVQLGAWRSEPEAQAGWGKARNRSGGLLDGLSAHIVMADLPAKGRYFRLRVATPNPAKLCAGLTAAGIACLPAR